MPNPYARLRNRWALLVDHSSDERRRAASYWTWRALTLLLLVGANAWDAAGLLVLGDDAYQSASFDVLKGLTPFGMRSYGLPLGAITVVGLIAYGRHRGGAGWSYVLLRLCLAMTAGFYVLWACGICGSWIIHGEIISWGIGKLVVLAGLAMMLALMTPTRPPPTGR